MRKGNWKRLVASTSIIAMVAANMSSDLSAMRFVYADDAGTSGEVSEASAEETPVVTESEPEEAPAEVAPTEEAPVEETPAGEVPAEAEALAAASAGRRYSLGLG